MAQPPTVLDCQWTYHHENNFQHLQIMKQNNFDDKQNTTLLSSFHDIEMDFLDFQEHQGTVRDQISSRLPRNTSKNHRTKE